MNNTIHPAGQVLQAFHDGELDTDTKAAVQAHCGQCTECRNEIEELEETTRLLAHSPSPELSRTVWHRVRPGHAREPRFKPVFAFAAGAAGVVLGILLGPVQFNEEIADTQVAWTETVTVWGGSASSTLLDIYQSGQE